MGDFFDKLDDDYIDVDGNGDNGVDDDIMIFNRWNNCSYIEDLNTSNFKQYINDIPNKQIKEKANYLIDFISSIREVRIDRVDSKDNPDMDDYQRKLIVIPDAELAIDMEHENIVDFFGAEPKSVSYDDCKEEVIKYIIDNKEQTDNKEHINISAIYMINDIVMSINGKKYISTDFINKFLSLKPIYKNDVIRSGVANARNYFWKDLLIEILHGEEGRNWVCDKTYFAKKESLEHSKLPYHAICYEDSHDIELAGNYIIENTKFNALGCDIDSLFNDTNIAIFTKEEILLSKDGGVKFHGMFIVDKEKSLENGRCTFRLTSEMLQRPHTK